MRETLYGITVLTTYRHLTECTSIFENIILACNTKFESLASTASIVVIIAAVKSVNGAVITSTLGHLGRLEIVKSISKSGTHVSTKTKMQYANNICRNKAKIIKHATSTYPSNDAHRTPLARYR